jgi:hypothetical protein
MQLDQASERQLGVFATASKIMRKARSKKTRPTLLADSERRYKDSLTL